MVMRDIFYHWVGVKMSLFILSNFPVKYFDRCCEMVEIPSSIKRQVVPSVISVMTYNTASVRTTHFTLHLACVIFVASLNYAEFSPFRCGAVRNEACALQNLGGKMRCFSSFFFKYLIWSTWNGQKNLVLGNPTVHRRHCMNIRTSLSPLTLPSFMCKFDRNSIYQNSCVCCLQRY